MHVLVLGGTKFIGPDVVRHLVGDGHAVTIFHRGQTEADLPPEVVHRHGDRATLGERRAEFARLEADVVVDMRPLGEVDARAVMETFAGITERVVAISSEDVYRAYGRLIGTEPGEPDAVPLTEDSPLRQRLYPYRGEQARAAADPMRWADDYDKILVERQVMGDPDLPGTILRLPMVYGPRDGQHRFWSYLKRMDDGRPAIILGADTARWRTTRSFVENVAAAIARAATDRRAAGRIYNVAEPEVPTEAAFVRELAEVVGWSGEVVVVPEEKLDLLPPALVFEGDARQDLLASSDRIRQELGYVEPVPRHQALARTIAWERQNPPPDDPAQFDYAAEDALLAALGRVSE
jgi:nucleoside-diphosphate-sugar epimerase